MKNEINIKKEAGITLVALVVTIIVLLILAGISISLVLGQTGIFSKAGQAKIKTEESSLQEEIKLAWLTVKTNHQGKITGIEVQAADELKTQLDMLQTETTAQYKEEKGTIEGIYKTKKYKIQIESGTVTIEEKVVVGEIVTQQNKEFMDADGKTATIPVGFAIVPGCETVTEGLVISDVANDTANKGNQFVWIPVDGNNMETSFIKKAGYHNGSLQDISEYAEIDRSGINSNGVEEDQATKAEVSSMYTSVENNGGFFIGRYETGKDENGNMVVKKNAAVYNDITWGHSMTDSTGGVVELARNFALKQGYDTNKVHSTLCYGVQWDTALQFIDPEWNSFVKDGTGTGNYSETLINTGSNEEYKQKNIYDMAGNVWEWTMETNLTTNRAIRGGNYNNIASNHPSSRRATSAPIHHDVIIGFRTTLYL